MERARVERLLAAFAPDATLVSIAPLSGGVSSLMTRVDVETSQLASRLVIRRLGESTRQHNPTSLEREHRVLGHALAAGVPVPTIVFADLDGRVLGEPLLVLEYIEGEVATAAADPLALARELADAMAAIHRIDASGWGLASPSALSARRPEPAAVHDNPILANAYEALAPRLGCLPTTPALLHGDLWPGNLLVRDGRLVAILDWEDARLGDPLIDIAITRLDLLRLYGEAAVHAFTERMAEHRPMSQHDLAFADLYAALRPGDQLDLWAEAYPTLGRPDVTGASMREAQGRFAEKALARL